LAYLTFGSEIQAVVLVNLNPHSKMVQSVSRTRLRFLYTTLTLYFYTQVQFLYALAILLSVPLQFFPAVRILENGLFTRSGKADTRVKWLKNLFRFGMVLVCTTISWVGAADLDKFVAFIGCFAWCVFVSPFFLCALSVFRSLADFFIYFILFFIFVLFFLAYRCAMSIRPCCITERVPARESKRRRILR